MGRRMSKEGIATLQHASMGLLCDPRKHEEILNDLWVEWLKLALELELENIVRRRFPRHSEGAYGRLERWIDELGFIGSEVRFLAQRLWRVIVRRRSRSGSRAANVPSSSAAHRHSRGDPLTNPSVETQGNTASARTYGSRLTNIQPRRAPR
jgi:hypothetical protein